MGVLQEILPACQNCDKGSFDLFCARCLGELKFKDACKTCGTYPLSSGLNECLPCSKKKKIWDYHYLSFKYEEGVRSWLLDIKDHLRTERIRDLNLQHLPVLNENYDAIVHVSSDPNNTRRRLFDSSLIFARRLSVLWGIPLLPNIFERIPFLASQRDLDSELRKRYLSRTVRLKALPLQKHKRLLLVDDVMTTGASLEVHARLLRPLAEEIGVYCLARALKT